MDLSLPEAEAPEVAAQRRNPDWTRDETIFLMDLYLSAPKAGRNHPEVLALSTLLRAAARRGGRSVSMSFRNTAGIAMRLRNFGRHDPAAPPERDAGLRPVGVIDALVWRAFGDDRQSLAMGVARVRRSIATEGWQPSSRSSHGPAPSFGLYSMEMRDGPSGVYLLLIDGPIEVLARGFAPVADAALVKIGRTNDLKRRMAELASGLPSVSAIRYVPVELRMFATGKEAHAYERSLLDLCDVNGWSLGGEFAYCSLGALKLALRELPALEPVGLRGTSGT